MEETIEIQLLESVLVASQNLHFVEDPTVGGIVQFIGTVRNHTKDRKVHFLEFESYAPMAISEMRKIAVQVQEKFAATKVSIHHRVGKLEIGEIAVLIAVACPHRAAAFEGCQYAIDALKETVPIWKKEHFEGGEIWIAAHP